MKEKTTDVLTDVLKKTGVKHLEQYFDTYHEKIENEEKPFAAYMRSQFRKKGILQQDVFLAADLSEGYGYKLISEEKRTKQRDVILRICIVAGFSLEEVQRALKLYGMSPLYPRIKRDAALIVAINTGIKDLSEVDQILISYELEPLYACAPAE